MISLLHGLSIASDAACNIWWDSWTRFTAGASKRPQLRVRLFQICRGFAQFERSMIQERVKAGLARAKANGKVLGRPRVSASIEERIRELRADGRGILSIARELCVDGGTVQRVLNSEQQRCPT